MSEKVERLCAELSLAAVGEQYANLADEAAKKKRSFVEYLEQVLGAEAALRAERSRQMLIKLATFPVVKTLEQFDFEAAPGAPKARLQELSGLAFVERPDRGPPRAVRGRHPAWMVDPVFDEIPGAGQAAGVVVPESESVGLAFRIQLEPQDALVVREDL